SPSGLMVWAASNRAKPGERRRRPNLPTAACWHNLVRSLQTQPHRRGTLAAWAGTPRQPLRDCCPSGAGPLTSPPNSSAAGAPPLALLEEGQPVLGVIDLPFLGQRYWATAGGGAFVNGEPIPAPARPRMLGEAIVALGDFATGPDAAEQNDLQLRLAGLLAGRALRIRMLGSAAV